MSDNVDLNLLRTVVLTNQREGMARPNEPDRKLFVNSDGKLVEGTQAQRDMRTLSEVPQETFASRLDVDRTTVRNKFPKSTIELTTPNGLVGWMYSITCELGRQYKLFAYFDGNHYQVKLVEPQLEKKWHSPHTGHLFSDGRICFGTQYGSGMPQLQDAFAKSVLWATGMSVALVDGHQFPFSINQ
jgi:hypothetical protein